ncbi:hypothetical protein G9A89_002750 [Geosiphon pyriformis]|nr:hypothetical protein G9A89_002750 [Geosiphon pyriformis]
MITLAQGTNGLETFGSLLLSNFKIKQASTTNNSVSSFLSTHSGNASNVPFSFTAVPAIRKRLCNKYNGSNIVTLTKDQNSPEYIIIDDDIDDKQNQQEKCILKSSGQTIFSSLPISEKGREVINVECSDEKEVESYEPSSNKSLKPDLLQVMQLEADSVLLSSSEQCRSGEIGKEIIEVHSSDEEATNDHRKKRKIAKSGFPQNQNIIVIDEDHLERNSISTRAIADSPLEYVDNNTRSTNILHQSRSSLIIQQPQFSINHLPIIHNPLLNERIISPDKYFEEYRETIFNMAIADIFYRAFPQYRPWDMHQMCYQVMPYSVFEDLWRQNRHFGYFCYFLVAYYLEAGLKEAIYFVKCLIQPLAPQILHHKPNEIRVFARQGQLDIKVINNLKITKF